MMETRGGAAVLMPYAYISKGNVCVAWSSHALPHTSGTPYVSASLYRIRTALTADVIYIDLPTRLKQLRNSWSRMMDDAALRAAVCTTPVK